MLTRSTLSLVAAFSAAFLLLLIPPGIVHAAPLVYSVAGSTPDFSQHSGAGWMNYCAPTDGANVAYYFSSTYAGLAQGPDNTIAGAAAPPPLVGSMADLMATSTSAGTTATNLRDGLDAYLEAKPR